MAAAAATVDVGAPRFLTEWVADAVSPVLSIGRCHGAPFAIRVFERSARPLWSPVRVPRPYSSIQRRGMSEVGRSQAGCRILRAIASRRSADLLPLVSHRE